MTATATAVAPSLDVAQSSQAVNPNPSARRGTYEKWLTISRVWILPNVGARHVEWQFIWLIYVHGRYEREATLNWSMSSMIVYLGGGRQQRERRQQWQRQRRLRASMISSVPTAVKRQSSQIWKTLPLYRGNQLRYTTPQCNQSLRPMNQGEAGLLHGFCYGQL